MTEAAPIPRTSINESSEWPELPVSSRDSARDADDHPRRARQESGTFRTPSSARYELGRLLHESASARIVEAWDTQLEAQVAIKILESKARSSSEVLRDTRRLRCVRHRHLVQTYDVVCHDEKLGVVMEYLEGRPLRSYLTDAAREPHELARLFAGLADAVAYLHAQGLVLGELAADDIVVCEGRGAVLTSRARELERSGDTASSAVDPAITRDVQALWSVFAEIIGVLRPGVLSEETPARTASALEAQLAELARSTFEVASVLVLAPDARAFRMRTGEVVSLARRRTLLGLVQRLVQQLRDAPRSPVYVPELLSAGWPGERINFRAGQNRVYVAVAQLRRLGLREAILSDGEGYYLDPNVVRIAEV